MADVVRVKFTDWGKYEAQETGEPPDSPDIKRPPDHLPRPGPDNERIEAPDKDGPGAPPFTGEDVEDVGRPKRERPM